MSEQDEAAEAVAEAMERALMLAAQSVERELSRIVKAGKDDIERMSRRLAEILANGAIDSVMGLASGGPQGAVETAAKADQRTRLRRQLRGRRRG